MARISKAQEQINADAALKAEQQAELKRLRAAKAAATRATNKAAKASTEHVVPGVVEAFDPAAEDAARSEKISAAWDHLLDQVGGIELPSWKRSLTGCILALAAAVGVGYVVGQVAGLLMVASVAATGVMWVAYAIMALGLVIASIAGGKIAQVVFGYVAECRIDDHYASAKRRVSGWFKRDEVVQFSGAHQS